MVSAPKQPSAAETCEVAGVLRGVPARLLRASRRFAVLRMTSYVHAATTHTCLV